PAARRRGRARRGSSRPAVAAVSPPACLVDHRGILGYRPRRGGSVLNASQGCPPAVHRAISASESSGITMEMRSIPVHHATPSKRGDHMPDNTETGEPSGAQRMFGDFAPGLVGLTDAVLFGQVWKRRQLSPKERSLVTVASLTTAGTRSSSSITSALPRTTARRRRSSSKRSPIWRSTPGGRRQCPRWLSPSKCSAVTTTNTGVQHMRGAILYAPRDVRFEERDDPTILEPTDAIIRLSATCVCGSDLWPYRGIETVEGPAPMGHEYVGIVE